MESVLERRESTMTAEYTGKLIRRYRQEKQMTQKELAERLHVTNKAVSKWERGKNYPDFLLLPALAQILGTTVSDLLGLEEPVKEKTVRAMTDLSRWEQQRLLRSLLVYVIATMVLGFLTILLLWNANYPERILLVLSLILFLRGGMLAESLVKKIRLGREYSWPEGQEIRFLQSVKIQVLMWKRRLLERKKEKI